MNDPDKNTRVCLRTTIEISTPNKPNLMADVFVAHISYDKNVQCRNMAEIFSFINKKFLDNDESNPNNIQFVLGDFNAYNDYEHAVNLLTNFQTMDQNPCLYLVL